MLDPAFVREHFEAVVARLGARGGEAAASLSRFQALEAERRRLIPLVENLKRDDKLRGRSRGQGQKRRSGSECDLRDNKARGGQNSRPGNRPGGLESAATPCCCACPICRTTACRGEIGRDNVKFDDGDAAAFDSEPKPHWELGAGAGILDFERATAHVGREVFRAARRRSAAGPRADQFDARLHTREHGYKEVEPPFLVNAKALVLLPVAAAASHDAPREHDRHQIVGAELPSMNFCAARRTRFVFDGRVCRSSRTMT